MDPNTFPTKGNLIAAKNSLKLATMPFNVHRCVFGGSKVSGNMND